MATYYIKSSGGTGSGLDDANAWSLAKYSSMEATIPTGSILLFNKGDIFNVRITAEAANLTYSSYGAGENPIITGLTQLTSWTLSSGNIYYATLDMPRVNIVTLDGIAKGMGRYPNSGYLTYTSHSTNTSITSTAIGGIPFDPTGSEVVIRKYRWILDRHPVTSRVSNTLNYSSNNDYGNNNAYQPLDGNGFFIQGALGCLTEEGDWFYDNPNNRLYMHFGSGIPSGRIVKAPTLDKNTQVNYWTGITFNNLTFEGGNLYGTWNIGTNNITYNNCKWINQGADAIWGSFVDGLHINGGSIDNSFNNGINLLQTNNNAIIENITIKNSGVIAGMGGSGDNHQQGITIDGINAIVRNCRVVNSGHNGINVSGDDPLVEYNYVDRSGLIKDDSGGIYTYLGERAIIRYNKIYNSLGNFDGAGWSYWEPFGKSAGIYLDNGVTNHNAQVYDNCIDTGGWAGIFINNNGENTITNNIVTNFGESQLFISDYAAGVRTLTITNNKFICKTTDQVCFNIELGQTDNLSLLGTINNNIYTKPSSNLLFRLYRNYSGGGITEYTLPQWQALYTLESTSVSNPKGITTGGKLLTIGGKIAIISS